MSRLSDKKAREIAFSIMFSSEFGNQDIDEVLELKLLSSETKGIKALIRKKISVWKRNSSVIDVTIESYLKRGTIRDLAMVAKVVLRLGITEMEYIDEIPPEVAINEAVELAKIYGDNDLARFVNGVLDARLKALRSKGEINDERKESKQEG